VSVCYVCGLDLNDETTSDHIIPNALFLSGDPHRPQLPVHKVCNNKKSIDDKWFVKQLLFRCSFRDEAEFEISKMIDKAISERQNAYLVGEKPSTYIFTKGMFDQMNHMMQVQHNGQQVAYFQTTKVALDRFDRYLGQMMRGLFIYNNLEAKPSYPSFISRQYKQLEVKGSIDNFMSTVKDLAEKTKSNRFGQVWRDKTFRDRIFYFGTRARESGDKGFVFAQFFNQFGILAFFM
jgi:hypothetical protein